MTIQNWRDWDMSLGPVAGNAGDVVVVPITPQCLFRVEKVMAHDTGNPPGTATRIMQFTVGNRIQRPTANGSTLAVFFGPHSLGNGMCWDTCQKGLTISVTVSFVETATFDMSLFGKAVV